MLEHQDSNEQAIRELAYQLWQEEGRPQGRGLENWLEAEARVRVKSNIPYPIAFCDFSVEIPRTLATPTSMQVACPTPEPGYITIGSWRSGLVQGATVVPLETLVHDSRVLLVELTTATVLLDRIARLAECIANSAQFLESDPSSGALRLPYIRALLDPAKHETIVGELERAISHLPYANFVAFEITGISLESPAKIKGKAKVLSSIGAVAMLSIVGFFTSFAKQIGSELPKEGVKIIDTVFQGTEENRKEIHRYLAAEITEKKGIAVMQRCLSVLGYDPGRPDGKYGPHTQAALQQFCEREHVPYDWPHGKAAISQLAYAAAAMAAPHGIWNQVGLGFERSRPWSDEEKQSLRHAE
jgi:hypothetical protein